MITRRRVLVLGTVGLAGCATGPSPGGRGPPTPAGPGNDPLRIVDFDTDVASDGSLIVWVVVENRASTRRSGTVAIQVRAGDRREQQSVSVTVDAGGRHREEITFDMTASEFEDDGDISLRIE
ncbi:MAG: hypothetical protein R3324_02060 [Halobacteriales archaeon]|nr:hypothetical protein [Halobacteriales archaeon]